MKMKHNIDISEIKKIVFDVEIEIEFCEEIKKITGFGAFNEHGGKISILTPSFFGGTKISYQEISKTLYDIINKEYSSLGGIFPYRIETLGFSGS